MTALDTLNAARLAWEQSQPQTFIDFDALSESAGAMPLPRDNPLNRDGGHGEQGSSANPADSETASTRNTNGGARISLDGKSASTPEGG